MNLNKTNKTIINIKNIYNSVIGLFFPDYCPGCGTPLVSGEHYICTDCILIHQGETVKQGSIEDFMALFRHPLLPGWSDTEVSHARCAAGVRLEDLKRHPEQTMTRISRWMGIDMHPSLLRSEFMGLQYWGPESISDKPITGFDQAPIQRKAGKLFGERDIELLRVLMAPFCTLYGYEAPAGDLKAHLKRVRPWLNQPLQFEQRILEEKGYKDINLNELTASLHLRTLLTRCLDLLEALGTYPGMVPPLE